MPAFADTEEIKDLLAKTKRINRSSWEYFTNHFEELQRSHGGEVVAIVDTSVVDSMEQTTEMSKIQGFVAEVREEHGDDAFITHIPSPDETMIL